MKLQARLFLFAFILISSIRSIFAGSIHVIPIPMQVTEGKGVFNINSSTIILIDETNGTKEISDLFAEKIRLSSRLNLETRSYNAAFPKNNSIIFTTLGADVSLGKEGYTIDISETNINVSAVSANGFFYGLQTLFQLLPPDIEKQSVVVKTFTLPTVTIKDKPRFAYRGMHLDVGRHLFPVEFIKKYIDLMAMYKMNTFHWHLTDDQGWRIEIKKYPELTRIGSIRKGTQIGKTSESDSIPYSGFYTQDQAREIVAYAASKYITVIPEIEMPGHSIAALTAYPRLSCTGGPFEVRTKWGVADDILCAGNDSVFTFVQDVLSEILDIFPSAYIHIGGDEAPKVRWEVCPKCQARIKSEGLKNEAELQSYFIKRIEKFLVSKNRRLIGWDEILEGGLSPDATVMAWRGIQAAIDAAAEGHDAIMTPVDYCYFDYYQGDQATKHEAVGGPLTLKTVYSYNPVPPVLTDEQAVHIIGVQGNVWTEYIKTPDYAEYMAFPRAIALAEVAWSQQYRRNWDDFRARLDKQYPRLDNLGVKYSQGSFNVDISTQRDKNLNLAVLSGESSGMEIRYTIDGSDPSINSTLYSKPFNLSRSAPVKAALFSKDKIAGDVCQSDINVNKASGKPVTIIKPYSFKYPGTGNQTMTDGLMGTSSYKSGWQGYEGTDIEFTVDLLQPTKISSMKLNFVKSPSDWVLYPTEVVFSISLDGKTWKNLESTKFEASSPSLKEIKPAGNTFRETVVRYIKVSAISPRSLPEWHEYKGEPCWIFCDELVVE
ncbi:MAG: glycoside hydrolase family 20 protein [Bacteroidales bacterium]|nr:glycoside hydrolase family 20 protein [Bacteroidales bacterium]